MTSSESRASLYHMNEHSIRHMLEGGGGLPGLFLRASLWFPGVCYGAAMELRRTSYLTGLLPSSRAPVPVISVGNLTAGGSGKTPMVVLLANEMLSRGLKPGILLRGYRQDGDGWSDEAMLYRRLCPEAEIRTGVNRLASGAAAVEAGAQVLLLDDGYQHLKIKRDMDIVLVDATSPWGGGNTIPGGLLREPRRMIRYAHIVILTRSDQVDGRTLGSLRREIGRLVPGVPVLTARHKPVRLNRLNGEGLELGRLKGRVVAALSGIARPEAFRRTLESLGARVAFEVAGRDHGGFGPDALRGVLRRADALGAVVVTTEKDRAKRFLSESADNIADNNNVWVVGVDQELDDIGKLRLLLDRVLRRGEKGH